MNHERLQYCIDCYGSDPAAWPLRARWRGRRLLARDAVARQMLEQAQGLDAQLTTALAAPEPDALDRLQSRLLTIPQRYPQLGGASQTPRPVAVAPWIWRGALLSGTAALVGFVAGLNGFMAPDIAVDWAMLAYGAY